MDCEICGSENAGTRILMDNRKIMVCPDCTNFGEQIQENTGAKENNFKQVQASSLGEFDDYALVNGFGQKIKSARQRKNISIMELGQKIFEKESFLHKIEAGKRIPDKKLAEKLENFFGIKIIE